MVGPSVTQNSTLVPTLRLILTLLTLVGSQGDACAEDSLMSCPTTLTASTTIGFSLVQAASLSRRNAHFEGGDTHKQSLTSSEPDVPMGGITNTKDVGQYLEGLQVRAASLLQGLGQVMHEASGGSLSPEVRTRRAAGMMIFLVVMMIFFGGVFFVMTRTDGSSQKLATARGSDSTSPRMGMATRSPNLSMTAGRPTPPFGTRLGTPNGVVSNTPESAKSLPRRVDATISSDDEQAQQGDNQFCPDLVVPQQCECILVVPVYAPVGNFSVCDLNGRAVLHASSKNGGTAAKDRGDLWQLSVQTATGEALAHCVEVKSAAGSSATELEFNILDAKAAYFGNLVTLPGQQHFQLTTQAGDKLHFWGNFQTQAVNVTDEQGGLLATTEPCGVDFDQTGIYYRLRVAPLANVGHSLCALLCIGQILKAR